MNESTSATNKHTANTIDKSALSAEGVTHPVPAEIPLKHPIQGLVENYLLAIRNIEQTVGIVMPHLAEWQQDEIKKNQKLLTRLIHGGVKDKVGSKRLLAPAQDLPQLLAIIRTLDELCNSKALPVLARSLFMQMFSEFDAFMGALLKTIYRKNQDLLKGIAGEITLRELFEHSTIDDAKVAMLDKEIETFRRDSYAAQFSRLEKKFQIKLTKFDEYPEFIELSQRRNIFTHNDGVVSKQYLSVCEKEGWKFPKRPVIGVTLDVDLKYFSRALQVMSKVGYMVAYTLWLKVFPQEYAELHDSISDPIYQCLEQKNWQLAAELGSFALSAPMKKNVTERNLRIRTINTAIGLTFSEQNGEARKLLESLDWTASYRDFKLAIHILEEEYDEAVNLMREIGKSGDILNRYAYHSWPLFHKFRERSEFFSTYKEIYGEPYATEVPTDGKSTSVSVMDASQSASIETEKSANGASPSKVVAAVGIRSAKVASPKRSPRAPRNKAA